MDLKSGANVLHIECIKKNRGQTVSQSERQQQLIVYTNMKEKKEHNQERTNLKVSQSYDQISYGYDHLVPAPQLRKKDID